MTLHNRRARTACFFLNFRVDRRWPIVFLLCFGLVSYCSSAMPGRVLASNQAGVAEAILWRYQMGREIKGAAVGPDGSVYVGSVDGLICALNGDGSEKWRFDAKASVGDIAIDDAGFIFVAARNLYAPSSKVIAGNGGIYLGGMVQA